MKRILFSCFCLIVVAAQTIFCQEIIYYDKDGKEVDSTAEYTRCVERSLLPNNWIYIKEFYEKKQVNWEGAFSVYTDKERVAEGTHRHYRKNSASLWYQEEYKAGRLRQLLSYYPDGKLKRTEKYRKGKFVKGTCLNPDGSSRPFTRFAIPPEYPGGTDQLFAYIAQNINYPALARENNIQGTVLLYFDINKDGSCTNVQVAKDPGAGCGQEALRVINAMSRWSPGLQDDEPVKVRFTLPIGFKLE